MKRARARASLALGAVALAAFGGAAIGGAALGGATDAAAIGSPGLLVGRMSAPSDEQQGGEPTDDPIVVGDPHDGDHGEMASPNPVEPSDAHENGGHDMSGHDMTGQDMTGHDDPDASPTPGDDPAGSSHGDETSSHGDGGHDGQRVEERPRALVLSGFAALNAFVFAAAAFVRHRDRNSA